MILIDDRGGNRAKSSDGHYPTRLSALIPNSILCRLDSGDVAFSGVNGLMIGIELKKVSDALGCLYSSRLADMQLPAMSKIYDVRYLVVEELYRAEPSTGVLQRWKAFPSDREVHCGRWYDAHIGRNRMMYQSFEMWLHTMSEMGQARLEKTPSIEGTASLIQSLYTWWNREDHKSFNVFEETWGESASLSRPSMNRRIFALLPHVGWKRSAVFAKRFPSVAFAVQSKPEDWYIKGEIAEKSARDIVEALNGMD